MKGEEIWSEGGTVEREGGVREGMGKEGEEGRGREGGYREGERERLGERELCNVEVVV